MVFTWSYSKVKNYETCPLRYEQVDILKKYKEVSEQLAWGDQVHKALAAAVSSTQKLPESMLPYQRWVDDIKAKPGEILVEQKFAIDDKFQPVEYFSPRVWLRGIGDVVRIDGPVAQIYDWKTGKLKIDYTQMMIMAQMVFSHFPEVQRLWAGFIWLQDDVETHEKYNRDEMVQHWPGLLERVKRLQQAHITKMFPAKPGYLCYKYCPVMTCEHHGKSYR